MGSASDVSAVFRVGMAPLSMKEEMQPSDVLSVSVLCSSQQHPVFPRLEEWGRYSELRTKASQLSGGDLLFLVSCTELIPSDIRNLYSKTLVLHASDLPQGRGWSPHVWQIIEGGKELVVSLIEAEDIVDTGAIWAKEHIELEGTELFDEINDLVFAAEIRLMNRAIDQFSFMTPTPQVGSSTYYPRRTRQDSRISVELPIQAQFDLLRVADPDRYPAWFEFRGKKFKIRVERFD